MQEREKMSSMDINVYLSNLRRNPKFKEEVVSLVEQDLQYGLTVEEIELYSTKKWNLAQMKIYSKCLRNGYPQEVRDCIVKKGLTAEQMAVALEFYEKGVSLDTIEKVVNDRERTAFEMKKMFQGFMEKVPEAVKLAEEQGAYIKELLEQMKSVAEKIEFQEKRYDTLNEKLKEMQTAERDKETLLNRMVEMEQMIEKQQNELNEARAAVVRLRNEKEKIEKEAKKLEQQIEALRREAEEKKMAEKEEEMVKKLENRREEAKETIKKSESKREETGKKGTSEAEKIENSSYSQGGYQRAVLDKDGNVISVMSSEHMERKKEKAVLTALFSRMTFKKKTDIVKLVVEKNLEPKQLIQIRSAIEKGLSEEQILVLINNQIPAEQMKEIINIAVYENKQKEE